MLKVPAVSSEAFRSSPTPADSPPLFPAVQSGLPATHKWDENWVDATIDYEEVDFNVPQPAWIKDTYHLVLHASQDGSFCRETHHLP